MDWYKCRSIGMAAVKRGICTHYHGENYLKSSSNEWLLTRSNGIESASKIAHTSGYKATYSGWMETGGYRAYTSSSKDEQRARIMKQIDDILSKPSTTSKMSAEIHELIEQTYGKNDQEFNSPVEVLKKTSETHPLEDQAPEVAEFLKAMAGNDEGTTVKKIIEMLERIWQQISDHGTEIRCLKGEVTDTNNLLKKILNIIEPKHSNNVDTSLAIVEAGTDGKPWMTTERFVGLLKLLLGKVVERYPDNHELVIGLNYINQILRDEDYVRILDGGKKAAMETLDTTDGRAKMKLQKLKVRVKLAFMKRLRPVMKSKALKVAGTLSSAFFFSWLSKYLFKIFFG